MRIDNVPDSTDLDPDLAAALAAARSVTVPASRAELLELTMGGAGADTFEVEYEVPGRGVVKEADVVRCRNGVAVNYVEDYIRRRDPDCMRIADDLPSDKPRFREAYGYGFDDLKKLTLAWLAEQDLVVVPFKAGGLSLGYPSLAVVPRNAAFFALALVDLQGWVTFDEIGPFAPRSLLVLAPPFRHTHFEGRQVVVHDRSETQHAIWAYNLYPGPSAKKGVFSALLDIGEREGWITGHASSVRVTTPYDSETVFMHEGASGGGKSELTQEIARQDDGRVLVGTNVVTGEDYAITLGESSRLHPVTDDMTLIHPALPHAPGKVAVADAEDGWFVRVDGITEYGTDPNFEKACIHPDAPLLFFNIRATPGATCLPWEHALEADGTPCSNPRVVIPRRMIKSIVSEPQEVDIRTFGVRMPPCTRDHPTYGIMGMTHVVPPALAWLWRLVTPRGDKNPSIQATASEAARIAEGGMVAEGVGAFWPFSTGTRVAAANLLLRQIVEASDTMYVLTPNQHVGAYKVGFAAEWLTREYLARRGRIPERQLVPARCALFGYALGEMKLDGQQIRPTLLRPEHQSRVGLEAYDAGAAILTDFFRSELAPYLECPDLDPLGRAVIEVALRDGTLDDYLGLTPLAD